MWEEGLRGSAWDGEKGGTAWWPHARPALCAAALGRVNSPGAARASAQVTREAVGNTAAGGHRPGGGESLGRRTPYPPTPEAKSRDEPSTKGAPLLHPEVSYGAPTQWF